MKATRIFSILLCAVLALCAIGCTKKAPVPYKDSSYLGEWKANSILSRDESVIRYTTLSITFNADGTCNYNGSSAKWTPDSEGKFIVVDLGKENGTIKFNIVDEAGRVALKYRIDTYYRASEFEAKDSETVALVTKGPSADDPEAPEPVER